MANFLKSLFVKGVEIDPAGATSNQVLKYNGTKFVPGTASTVGSIDDLSDVIVTTPSNGQALVFDGTNWVNGASGVAGSTYTATIGDGTNDVFVLSHGLNTRDVFVTIRNAASPYEVIDAYWAATTTGTVTIDFSVVPTTNSVRVAIYAAVTGNNTALSLDNLTDAVITSPLEYESLVYNGTNWVNQYASTATYVRNAEATTLTTGTVVYLFGATGDHATVKRADNDSDTTSSKTVGLVASPIAASENGPVVTRGYVDGINLSTGYASGDVLWLGEDGAFTKVKPTAPEHLVFIGVVVRATNNGIIYVATQNGYELDELHNVSLPNPTAGQVLTYNGSLWTAASASGVSVLDDLTDVSAASPVQYQPLIWDGTNWQSETYNQTMRLGESGVSDWVELTPTSLDFHPIDGRSGQFNPYGVNVYTGDTYVELTSGYVTSNNDNFRFEVNYDGVEWDNYVTNESVSISPFGATNGQVLAFNTGSLSYVPSNIPIDSLSDVVITSPTDGQVLKYNTATSLWTNASAGGGASITVSDTPPVSPAAGALWFESDSGLTFIYYDSQWIEIGAGASYDPITGIVQAKGDLILGTASQTVDRLTVGANSQRLIANSSASTGVSWASDSTNTVIDAKGDLLVGATNDVVARLPVGTDNQMLVANSSATNGLAWVDQPSGFRNKIINGAMTISQRGTSAISNVGGTDVYGTDRWCIYGQTSSKMTITQSTVAPPGFSNSTVITSSAATTPASGDFYGLRQHIEGYNTTDLAWGTASAKPIVVSFWVRSSIAGSYSFTVLNPAASRCFISSYTISTINTWEKKIVYINGETTGSWATGNTTGVSIWFDMGSGSSQNGTAGTWNTSATFRTSGSTNLIGTNGATFYITGVQFEANTVATPFEYRPYGTELALCQRYYYRRGGGVGGVVSDVYLSGYQPASTNIIFSHFHPVEMRATPSLAQKVGVWALINTPSQPIIGSPSIYGYFIYITVNSGISNANQSAAYTNGSSNYLEFGAEL